MAERVDVLIGGSGFGGSITAYRLAELYKAAGADPKSIVLLERGRRHKHTDFRQSMDIENLSDIYELVQGQGAQVVAANALGGGSNLYLAASLRAPTETFERRDRRPGDGPDRRMWPAALSRKTLDPYYRRAELGLRVNRPEWNRVSKSGGLWAATLNAAGHTCDRVPVAINPDRCVDAKWCHTGCIFGAKNSLITNYLPSAERMGVQIRPDMRVESVRPSSARPYRYIVTVSQMDNEGASPTRQAKGTTEIECKVLILSAGAMGNAPILLRSQGSLPGLSSEVGKHLGVNGDHIAAIEYDPAKVRSVLGLPGYADFYKGKPITTMSYDWWVGRSAHRYDGTRFNLQEIFLSSLTNFLYDDGRAPAGDPSWWGLQKKQAIAHWANRIELLAMVEDTNDGTFFLSDPRGGGAIRPNAGPIEVGTFTYAFSEQSIAVREAANEAIRRVAERKGLGKFMKLTETQGSYASHPLGGCRMADSADLGVVDDHGEVYGNEGLYCIDSSIIPTSLGVNPSLTIAAVTERCADALVARGTDFGLPARPKGFKPAIPKEIVGERVIPKRAVVPGRRKPASRHVTAR
jgi:choline dehydrogenase-like flavoprotein